ncbi:GGDEF domain-containing response regulator [Desulfomonile tiedjei]|uniref:diguanylate cyclase n=1 Tax=Desulfomonile tiedjei (strain ATCC 49306 / DSM 6799 / DCB-1) TaxID=706587 RepID=I4C4J7_DESTA|nr:diguanylate cyclase [Desulfomonile tiedjei]AFM24488.1 diguanylate cyclase (GGDEF) domain-containing protein [Desulfomonile tiedjei DSM 6799]
MRILIAEDNRFFRRLLEANLKQWGHEVVSCEDGAEAWEILQKSDCPHLAILDWEMPRMLGIEVCKAVREQKNQPYIYLILLTAKTQKDDLVVGLDSGADDYLTKPFEPVELQVRLRAATRIIQLQEDLVSALRAAEVRAKEDSLTGLWNHSAIVEMLKREIERSFRQQRSLGIIMCDIDHFKRINDTFGHLEGDRSLKRVAEIIRTNLRQYDSVGRYGGEEFLVILPDCNAIQTVTLAERLREMVSCDVRLVMHDDVHLTVSFGATSIEAGSNINWEAAIRIADEALYEAKRNGRNRVVLRVLKDVNRTN